MELSITGIILVPKMLRCCVSCSRKVNAVFLMDIVSECRLKELLMSDDEDVAGKGGAAAGMGLLPHRQISHSIQTFYPTGTFTWLSL